MGFFFLFCGEVRGRSSETDMDNEGAITFYPLESRPVLPPELWAGMEIFYSELAAVAATYNMWLWSTENVTNEAEGPHFFTYIILINLLLNSHVW